MAKYEVKGKTTKFTAVSRCAIKIKDNYYTLELSEERVLPEDAEVDMDKEYEALFDNLNTQIDRQMEDVLNSINKR